LAINITRATAPTWSIKNLIAELDEFLAGGYAPEHRRGISFDAIFKPGIEFFTASAEGDIALYEDFAEIKRMHFNPPGAAAAPRRR